MKGDAVEYQESRDRCLVQNPFVCDYSRVDVINKTDGSNYWGIYDDECVGTVSAPSNVYDQACCLAYSIDNFDVYDNEVSHDNVQNGIRIY